MIILTLIEGGNVALRISSIWKLGSLMYDRTMVYTNEGINYKVQNTMEDIVNTMEQAQREGGIL